MGFEVLTGDALTRLRELPGETARVCVTSPPYFNLRDYGVPGQIGLEETPEAYVAKLVEVFREVRRVLTHDGTLWVNIADSFASGKGSCFNPGGGANSLGRERKEAGAHPLHRGNKSTLALSGLKPKDLIGIPWLLAFALRSDGWYLRSEIIWHKPNPMPESVTDRPTKAHEQIFLLSKSATYFYDAGAIAEAAMQPAGTPRLTGQHKRGVLQSLTSSTLGTNQGAATRNRRSVWTVTTKPFKEAHFATFPEALIEPCILAGSREGDTVLDPFSGAGTSGVVAVKRGRQFLGIELNPEYAEMSVRRIQEVLDRQPLLAVTKSNGADVCAPTPSELPGQADSGLPGVTFGNNGSVARRAGVVQ